MKEEAQRVMRCAKALDDALTRAKEFVDPYTRGFIEDFRTHLRIKTDIVVGKVGDY